MSATDQGEGEGGHGSVQVGTHDSAGTEGSGADRGPSRRPVALHPLAVWLGSAEASGA